MSFKTKTVMEQRLEFVLLANKADANMSQLCSRFKISRRAGYKWLTRYRTQGIIGLNNQSADSLLKEKDRKDKSEKIINHKIDSLQKIEVNILSKIDTYTDQTYSNSDLWYYAKIIALVILLIIYPVRLLILLLIWAIKHLKTQ
jgi:transposase